MDPLTAAVLLGQIPDPYLLVCESSNCTSDVEPCFHSALTQRKLAQDHPESPFMESLPLPPSLPGKSLITCCLFCQLKEWGHVTQLDVWACVLTCTCFGMLLYVYACRCEGAMCLCASGCLPNYCWKSKWSHDERRNRCAAIEIMLCFPGICCRTHSLQWHVLCADTDTQTSCKR